MTRQSETYQRILEAARDLIYARSYAEVGVKAICEKAEVKKGSFYHFFPSKQELTLAVIDNFYAELRDNVVQEAFDPALPPGERLERLFALTVARQEEIHRQTGHVLGCPFGNLASEMATSDETVRCRIEGLFTRFQGLFRDTLQEALERGELDEVAVDIEATAEAMLAYFEGVMLMAKARNDPGVLRQLLPGTARIRIPKNP